MPLSDARWEQIGNERYPVQQWQPPTMLGIDPLAAIAARRGGLQVPMLWQALGAQIGTQSSVNPISRLFGDVSQRWQQLTDRGSAARRLGLPERMQNEISRGGYSDFPIIQGPRGEQY